MAGNKRGASKGKEKECKAATTAGDGWKPKRTAGALKITWDWSKPYRDESQIPELLGMIKK
ncbi:hypothetical protein C2845_PM06G24630 [Panicum miliaceum]|uniref:Uncharacterized protein n=1 Tax=Panicum miliaceum TaxID=4540 RepID=A0A3L6R988_PANMI|nr:hypothetical protein C2845_PM06G24630 [Panicum miliaceum]